ncbi:MAG: hypothetical protein NDI61_12970 [Bdellovibrionaceae bacterium]|nr:hypothetical protein [Pseudobdellovibrionaceae bacterium]
MKTNILAVSVLLLGLSTTSVGRADSLDSGDEAVAESLSVENEVVDADIFAMDEIANENKAETARLQNEIRQLERGLKSSLSAADRAKQRTELTYKRLEVQKRIKADAEARLKRAEADRARADRKLSDVKAQVSKVDEKLASLKAKNADTRKSLQSLSREQADYSRRLKRAEQRIVAEKERQRKLRAEQTRLSQANRKLKTQVTRAENRAG